MTKAPAYILAGGRSSRFGSDKARAVLRGQPLLCHVVSLIESFVSSVTVVADRPGRYDDLGLRTIADQCPGLGPLAGLQASLTDLPHDEDWLLLCPCDAMVIRATWLQTLFAAPRANVQAIAFRGTFWQPMPALYSRGAITTVSTQLNHGRRRMQSLLDQLPNTALPLPRDWPDHWQANTPEILDRGQTLPNIIR